MFSSHFLGIIFHPYQKPDGLSNTGFPEFVGLIPCFSEEKIDNPRFPESPSPPPEMNNNQDKNLLCKLKRLV